MSLHHNVQVYLYESPQCESPAHTASSASGLCLVFYYTNICKAGDILFISSDQPCQQATTIPIVMALLLIPSRSLCDSRRWMEARVNHNDRAHNINFSGSLEPISVHVLEIKAVGSSNG